MTTHAVDNHKAAVAHANTEIYRRFGVRGPVEPGTEYHAEWLKEYDRAILEMYEAEDAECPRCGGIHTRAYQVHCRG